MQISHSHRFVFFSFPKTGSESVRELLQPWADERIVPFWERDDDHPYYSHMSPAEVEREFTARGLVFDEYYRFTFVRNPWARMVSLYNMIYHTRVSRSLGGKLKSLLTDMKTPSFRRWLDTIDNQGDGAGGPPDQRWRKYGAWSIRHYACDEDGRDLVDEVIKLEEIDTRLRPVLERIGIPGASRIEIPFVNKRSLKRYADYYDDASRRRIEQLYGYDIERFGYRFEDIL